MIWKAWKWPWPSIKYYIGICLEGVAKDASIRALINYLRTGRDTNPRLTERDVPLCLEEPHRVSDLNLCGLLSFNQRRTVIFSILYTRTTELLVQQRSSRHIRDVSDSNLGRVIG
jgi:hypothetical protein